MRDTIYRDDAIRVASGYCHPANVAKELAKLPSAEPCTEQISKTYTDGFDDGYNQGWKDGQDALLDDQWERGREDE